MPPPSPPPPPPPLDIRYHPNALADPDTDLARSDNTMGFHQDSYDGLSPGSAIAIVSLGATRRLAFRSFDRNHRHELALVHGSVLLMTAVTQRGWTHAVPREPAAGPRVSLTFRQAMTGSIRI